MFSRGADRCPAGDDQDDTGEASNPPYFSERGHICMVTGDMNYGDNVRPLAP